MAAQGGGCHAKGAATGSASDSAGSHCREKFYWVDATFSETMWAPGTCSVNISEALVTWYCHFPKKPVLEGGACPVAPRVSGVKKEKNKKKSVLVVPEQVRVRWEG